MAIDTDKAEDTSEDAGLERTIARFEQQDDAADASDEDARVEDEDGSDDAQADDDDDTSDDDTSGDDESQETDADSDDDDAQDGASEDDDTREDAGSDDDEDDEDADKADKKKNAGDEDEEPEDDEVSEETRAALAARGADLSLKDVPKEYRPILEKKLKSVDAAFTRRSQEFAASRKELTGARAEQKYRDENPDLVIVELLRKGGAALMNKVNARITKLDREADGADETSIKDYEDAIDATIKNRRDTARQTIEQQAAAEVQLHERSAEIETYARSAAKKMSIPFTRMLDRALAAEIRLKPEKDWASGLSEEEIDAVVHEYAREFHGHRRAGLREKSKEQVRERTKARARDGKRPARQSAVSTSPGPSRRRPKGDEDFVTAGMRTARRLFPGAKDD